MGGVCVLGAVWTTAEDGSVAANAASASHYVEAVRHASRLRGGSRCSRLVASAVGRGGVGGVVGNLHGGKYQFGPGGAASAVGGEFAKALAAGGSSVACGPRVGSGEAWRRLNPNLADAAEHSAGAPPPRWQQSLAPRAASLGASVRLQLQPPLYDDASGRTAAVLRLANGMRTWESFVAAVVDADGTPAAGLRALPASGIFAPRGGANNACDETNPYPDWVDMTVVATDATAAAGDLVAGSEGTARGRFLVIKTEEQQWAFPLVTLTGAEE